MLKRSDALKNRNDLLEAANVVFSEHGYDVPLALIAQRAGVSRTTLYRHFIDRQGLALAIFERNVAMLEDAPPALQGGPDAFYAMLELAVEHFCRSAGLAEALLLRESTPELGALRERVVRLLLPLAAAAHIARRVARPVGQADIGLILDVLCGISCARPLLERPAALRQALSLLWNGLAA